jgi:hypothetical protein
MCDIYIVRALNVYVMGGSAVEKKRKAQAVQREDEVVLSIDMPDGSQVKPEEVQGMTLKQCYQANALQEKNNALAEKAIASKEATAAIVALQMDKKMQIEILGLMLMHASGENKADLLRQLKALMSAPGVSNGATEATEATEANSAATMATGPTIVLED